MEIQRIHKKDCDRSIAQASPGLSLRRKPLMVLIALTFGVIHGVEKQ
ncbi:hypothetical protein F7734_43155 [Scytonema sp. UIC 10036]|nr:hypothetical protein [Scytonema sp. UIC 10036]MUG94120.1 hypothetical protein [Scytonema sp. UIC 10036]MUG95151.1 hypothetical protein [Scytonema sp. UIC 10036]MUG96982.1 hypothetical protein [Scytonema sp. UIC 10036]MUG98732.1 hypothetical protein [Scytonema sp. UIC 10036]